MHTTQPCNKALPHIEQCVQQIAPLKTLAQSLSLEKRLDRESAILLDETLATAGIEVEIEMTQFLGWLSEQTSMSGYIRAAIAKFYFVIIHPFDDSNGRLIRIIAERCLAECEGTDLRLYSLSHVIEPRRAEYYDLLEKCQRGTGDITEWIIFFLDALRESTFSTVE